MGFLSMAVAGCFASPPEVSIPPLTNGLVAEYQFAGTPAGFGYGTGSLLVDSAGGAAVPAPPGGGGLGRGLRPPPGPRHARASENSCSPRERKPSPGWPTPCRPLPA